MLINNFISFCEGYSNSRYFGTKLGRSGHRGQTSEHARGVELGSHRSIRKAVHMVVKTAAFSCELEAKFSFYFNEVHRR